MQYRDKTEARELVEEEEEGGRKRKSKEVGGGDGEKGGRKKRRQWRKRWKKEEEEAEEKEKRRKCNGDVSGGAGWQRQKTVAVASVHKKRARISRNITTNEVANSTRYSYLKGPGGWFRNPYDHGIQKNCSDFLIKGYSEDVELTEQIPPSEETGMIQMTRSTDSQNGENHSHQSNNVNVCIDGQSKSSRTHGHVNPSKCCNNNGKNDRAPRGLGLAVGRNASHNTRSILPL
ncbi:hypothetical protein B296_00003382 [Ensete ventricosum]|uniref:Uncharacterized protein n=1 Tax=Ensete ventricosum TaxID=4639 RepID=A0A427AHI9_ENSVE|nr:hypothetical protein B296_00003382 [Ensete ventricosum]